MNKISTKKEMRSFQARMIEGMYSSVDEFSERVHGHSEEDLEEYHKAFRNMARQIKSYQDGILEAHREFYHELFKGDESE